MNFSENSSSGIDIELQDFFEAQTQKRRFELLVHNLTDKCWDLCMGKVNTHLDIKTEGCLNNCVERFIDASDLIVNKLVKTQSITS